MHGAPVVVCITFRTDNKVMLMWTKHGTAPGALHSGKRKCDLLCAENSNRARKRLFIVSHINPFLFFLCARSISFKSVTVQFELGQSVKSFLLQENLWFLHSFRRFAIHNIVSLSARSPIFGHFHPPFCWIKPYRQEEWVLQELCVSWFNET